MECYLLDGSNQGFKPDERGGNVCIKTAKVNSLSIGMRAARTIINIKHAPSYGRHRYNRRYHTNGKENSLAFRFTIHVIVVLIPSPHFSKDGWIIEEKRRTRNPVHGSYYSFAWRHVRLGALPTHSCKFLDPDMKRDAGFSDAPRGRDVSSDFDDSIWGIRIGNTDKLAMPKGRHS
ncbi:hypothetical protein FA15DRAFT_743655 [Coprinopsis marcescibilis]|uniref:Uncharacterized protein n=1 Tax=Coprinopsis marcescibilis TaxID=230819 RepID=A0A5C3L6I7_COPMA|nr:hypothetical protein FA15DRAFT_743655 [Coprinopsis marcescibilis]